MTSTTDIGNRALALLGARSTIGSLTEQSNEAIQVSLAYPSISNWAFGLANWNFARETSALAGVKNLPGLNPGLWSNTYPSPPWLYEYTLPSDFIRAIYVTNSDPNSTAGWLGEPKRFAIGCDSYASVQQKVLFTNVFGAILIYTGMVADPTQWPWFFERMVVTALAHAMCMALTGDKKLRDELYQEFEQHLDIANQINTTEGLLIPDTTPEMIQALGINYPYRRMQQPQGKPSRNRGGDDNGN